MRARATYIYPVLFIILAFSFMSMAYNFEVQQTKLTKLEDQIIELEAENRTLHDTIFILNQALEKD